jgi:hypothetical protein
MGDWTQKVCVRRPRVLSIKTKMTTQKLTLMSNDIECLTEVVVLDLCIKRSKRKGRLVA